MLATGDLAPDFTLPRDGGEMVTLSALKPSKVVLYFYPRDDTPGCTTEGLEFTALAAEFEAAGAIVIGDLQGYRRQALTQLIAPKHDLGRRVLGCLCRQRYLASVYGTWRRKRGM